MNWVSTQRRLSSGQIFETRLGTSNTKIECLTCEHM